MEKIMDDREATIEAWKQTVAVQMHFNDLALRIRSFALTIIAAILVASGLGQGRANIGVLAGALIVWPAFFLMDRFWYHPLLLAAVGHGEAIEKHAQEVLHLTISTKEGDKSLLGLATSIRAESGKPLKILHFKKTMQLRSTRKMFWYYSLIYIALWVIFLAPLIS